MRYWSLTVPEVCTDLMAQLSRLGAYGVPTATGQHTLFAPRTSKGGYPGDLKALNALAPGWTPCMAVFENEPTGPSREEFRLRFCSSMAQAEEVAGVLRAGGEDAMVLEMPERSGTTGPDPLVVIARRGDVSAEDHALHLKELLPREHSERLSYKPADGRSEIWASDLIPTVGELDADAVADTVLMDALSTFERAQAYVEALLKSARLLDTETEQAAEHPVLRRVENTGRRRRLSAAVDGLTLARSELWSMLAPSAEPSAKP